ncbi:tRNA epoxyqueuosine(34) reductase QueG [Chamaesiphon sp. GL140_3_metabinner_50]|uniref:tRNA epoxyqueuosine(34) reductase QueG n=1 Tax=Chamaesiphon sp. GL140_3_metabinner_50 TaxID=2970812 RepID=UPI0025E724AB|nr:tRNA epoxyqueuosine(34) reductase QueG [Chamaesiphon sp. GL140_3_metabinner_50]
MQDAIANDLAQQIEARAREIGFHAVGIANIDPLTTQAAATRLQEWLALGYQADMAWMSDPRRQDIYQLMPGAKTVIAVALNYYTPHQRPDSPVYGKIARYAWGRDYHKVLTKKLKQLTAWLSQSFDGINARYYVDTGPIQDKFWAQAAGIGWIGKNGNVINRQYGSWIFIGEIVTDLALTPSQPHAQHCGTCTRCISACPTGAITQPFVVDANRCIAYHTIENRAETLPPEIAANLQGWVAGCDICQDVCPWNQRFAQPTDVADFQPYARNLDRTLTELGSLTDEAWDRSYTASALRRIKPAMWRRNAIANLHNLGIAIER